MRCGNTRGFKSHSVHFLYNSININQNHYILFYHLLNNRYIRISSNGYIPTYWGYASPCSYAAISSENSSQQKCDRYIVADIGLSYKTQ